VRSRATTVQGALGRLVSWDEAVEAMAIGFGEVLDLRLVPGMLTSEERDWAEQLRTTKYATDDWTFRV